MLEPGRTKLSTEFDGLPVRLGDFLAKGGQGEVYLGWLAGERVAIKWYFPTILAIDPDLRARLCRLRDSEPPSRKFLWPKDIVVSPDVAGFGYVMPFREEQFCELNIAIINHNPSLRIRVTAGYEIVEAYQKLHARGLCYHDISFGNVAFDVNTGEARICDCDNVGENGVPGRVAGTPRFMAPEVVERIAHPTRDTDLWSLAVLLFWLFQAADPLIGLRDPMEANPQETYGRRALFIWDPRDESNRPPAGEWRESALRAWNMYPQILRDRLIEAFTVGIQDPGRRVRETEWLNVLGRMRDSVLQCPACTAENFFERVDQTCWNCHQNLPRPMCIEVRGRSVVLTEHTALFGRHVDPLNAALTARPVARVVRHPQHPERLGLENLGPAPWQVVLPNGEEVTIEHDRRIRLEPGVRVNFGATEGTVT